MTEIFFPVLIVSGIGFTAGLVLSIASIIMNVPKNEKALKILDVLPGANCGACGFSGCEGYANALAKGKSKPGLCAPGGDEVANKISDILGVNNKKMDQKVAFVMCGGNVNCTDKKATYVGISSCAAAMQVHAGSGKCPYGCIGFGDCTKVCKYGAISIKNGIAKIDINKCVGCGMCVKACPKNIIKLITLKNQAIVNCSNSDKGILTKKACKVGCIGCKLCEKACNYDAIHVENNLATVDTQKCIGCGKCRDACPNGCISIVKCN